jgi:hypothetical protein
VRARGGPYRRIARRSERMDFILLDSMKKRRPTKKEGGLKGPRELKLPVLLNKWKT